MARATRLEAYMLRLINGERAAAGLGALRFDGDLNQCSDAHSRWMLAHDVLSHTGARRSDVADRAEAAGYRLIDDWIMGENVGLQSIGGARGLRDEVRTLHKRLMDSPDHRANILSGSFDEIGIGLRLGEYQGQVVVMATQNFARTGAGGSASMAMAPDQFVFVDSGDGSAGDPVTHERPAPSAPVDAAFPDMGRASVWHDTAWADVL